MQNSQLLENYFSEYLAKLDPNNLKLIKEAFAKVPDIYYDYPAASGEHHNALQNTKHGLLYHVREGLMAMDRLISARSDIMNRYRNYPAYKGVAPESDLYTAYLMHDICKYRLNPTGTNYEHDEAAYEFAQKLGFSQLVCDIIRFTHGQWSTAIKKRLADFRGKWYEDLVWISHYSDVVASSMDEMKFIERVEEFDKKVFSRNRENKKHDQSIDVDWWHNA